MAKDKNVSSNDEVEGSTPLVTDPTPVGEDDGFVPLPSPEEVLAQSSGATPAPTVVKTPSGAAIVNGAFVDTDRPDAGAPVDPLVAAKHDAPVTDAAGGLLDGVFKAGDSMAKMGAHIADGAKIAAGGVAKLFKPSQGEAIDKWVNAPGLGDQIRTNVQDFKNSPERQLFKPQTIAGNITSGVSQFVTGLIGAGKFLKGANLLQGAGKATAIARGLSAGAIADETVFDHEERLSNLIEQFPSLSTPVTRYLAANPEDSDAEDRFKSVLEGAMTSAAAEGLFIAVKAVRAWRIARKAGKAVSEEEAAKLADELEASQAKHEAPAPVEGEAKPTEALAVTEQATSESVDGIKKAASPEQIEAQHLALTSALDGGFKRPAEFVQKIEETVGGTVAPERLALLKHVAEAAEKHENLFAKTGEVSGDGVMGTYHPTGETINLDIAKLSDLAKERALKGRTASYGDAVAAATTHELVHGVTFRAMKAQPEVLGRVQAILDHYKKSSGDLKSYGVTNAYEFMSEALSNRAFQKKLDAVPWGKESLWKEVVGTIQDVLAKLGVPVTKGSTLEEALTAFEGIAKDAPQASKKFKPTMNVGSVGTGAEELTRNVEGPDQSIKDYIAERLAHPEGAPDVAVSRDFNAAKQVTTDGARQAINLMSDAMAPEIAKLKGGVQTFEKIRNLADIAGEHPEVLIARMSARAKDAAKMASDVYATEECMLLLARNISEEARRVDHGISKSPELLNAMQDQLASVIADLKAVKTGAARTTGAGRMVKSERVLDPIQLKALIAAGGDLPAVARIVKPTTLGRKLLNAHTEYWVNSILSGPKTFVVNGTTNLLQTIAAPIEKIAGGNVAEGLSQAMGLVKGIKDSIKMAAKAGVMEESILDPHLTKFDGPRSAISSKAFGLSEASPLGTAIDWLGKAVRLPTRLLMSSDEFFKQMNYRSAVYAKATREGVELGHKGAKLAEYIESRFESAFDGTGKGLDEAAMHEARLSTFTEPLAPGSFAQTVQGVTSKHPVTRLILPFVRTPTNIVKQLGWRTPGINMLMESYRAELKAGGSRAAAARGKMATGGLLWGGAALLAMEGRLTGRGPRDPAERATKMMSGWRPYSVKVGDKYYEIGRLDPFGMPMGLIADWTEAVGHMSQPDHENLAAAMGMALASNLTSKTYLRGITEFLDAMSQPDHKLEAWLQSRAASYVPSAFQQGAGLVGAGDNTMRETRSMMDAVFARTPGLSDNLPPRRNVLGEPITYPPALGPDSVSPFVASPELKDSVKSELARLSYGFKMPSEAYNERINLTKYKNEKGQDAYDRLLELRTIERKGRYTLKERLAHEIESERYQKLPDGNDEYTSKKLDKLRGIFGEYHEATMKRLRKEYPKLDADIRTDEHNVKAVKRKGVDAIQAFTQP